MKILLTLIMCSITTGECIAPYTHDKEYPDMYECLLDGYDMAADKTLEIGRFDVNEHGIYIKFYCKEIPTAWQYGKIMVRRDIFSPFTYSVFSLY